jgi:cation diffusion facilitator CzcD-associated flavoprotein CzcO
MREASVVIVGGGSAGLSSAGALKSRGISAVVLDAGAAVGSSWTRRYERLHLHTVRKFSGLADFPIPARYPKYLSKENYAEYLQTYAEHFGLDIELGCTVQRVRLDPENTPGSPAFLVETERETWRTPSVVIASGMYRQALIPSFPGLEAYRGRAVHAAGYTSGRDYTGKRVLVVGIGNTGAEIAVDLAEQGAAFVAISIRSTPPIVPRDLLGRPVQVSGMLLSRLPPRIADRIGRTLARLTFGNLSRYGIGAPDWLPFSAKRVPVIDVGFVAALKRGAVVARPNIARFTTDGVVFTDGREEAYDAVLFATGYATGLDKLVEIPGVLNEGAYPRSRSGEPSAQPGLYFMGFLHSNRGHIFETNVDSRKLAANIAGA